MAELEVFQSRPIAPTRRVALGTTLLPTSPMPGFGGLLLGGIVARFAPQLEPDLLPELLRLTHQVEAGHRIPQPRLRHRLQDDRIGLNAHRHRLLGSGDALQFDLDASASAAPSVLGAVYAAGILYMLCAARIIPYHALFFYGQTALFPFDAVFFVLTLYQRYKNIETSRVKLEREMRETLTKLASVSGAAPDTRKKGDYPRSKLAGLDVEKKLEMLDRILRVEKAFKEDGLTLSDLAARIGVTQHQLSEMCNAQLNTSFPKLLAYHRVTEARELLTRDDLNILQIAFESGFASKSAFNIEFKRVTGVTPREYRARPEQLRAVS